MGSIFLAKNRIRQNSWFKSAENRKLDLASRQSSLNDFRLIVEECCCAAGDQLGLSESFGT